MIGSSAGVGKKFRAYDKATGAVVSEIELPAGTTGAPMTYMHGGKQYIVVPIGWKEHDARVGRAWDCRRQSAVAVA